MTRRTKRQGEPTLTRGDAVAGNAVVGGAAVRDDAVGNAVGIIASGAILVTIITDTFASIVHHVIFLVFADVHDLRAERTRGMLRRGFANTVFVIAALGQRLVHNRGVGSSLERSAFASSSRRTTIWREIVVSRAARRFAKKRRIAMMSRFLPLMTRNSFR